MCESDSTDIVGIPPGPYFHGSRLRYQPGDLLRVDVVNNIEGEQDDGLMCFAIVSPAVALQWAYQRGFVHGGGDLFVYEVELTDPEVDVNMHGQGSCRPIESVMSPRGMWCEY